jgi:hypothetical protein
MKNKFTYSDIVNVRQDALEELRPGAKAWIVGVCLDKDRFGEYLKRFPHGVTYTIEYEDGSSVEIHEDDLLINNDHV